MGESRMGQFNVGEFNYHKDTNGIVTITMDMHDSVNAMNRACREALHATLKRLEAEPDLRGVIFTSAKKVFVAGGDLKEIFAFQPGDEGAIEKLLNGVKADFRRLEKLPVPVVAAINGAAMGGGFELCLACNFRIAVDGRGVAIGLPEVGLGLLPGGGGIVRLVNLLGLEKARPYLLEAKRVSAQEALQAGLVDETVESLEDLLPRARALILENADNSQAAIQPWDRPDFRVANESEKSPSTSDADGAGLHTKAQDSIARCALAVTQVPFEEALRLETLALVELVLTPEAKTLISGFLSKS